MIAIPVWVSSTMVKHRKNRFKNIRVCAQEMYPQSNMNNQQKNRLENITICAKVRTLNRKKFKQYFSCLYVSYKYN